MSAKMAIATTAKTQCCPAPAPKQKYSTKEELKNKYESYEMTTEEISLDISKKTKVKRIASIFDSIISENVEGAAENEDKSTVESLLTTREAAKANFIKDKSPIPSPRTKSKLKAQQNSKTFFVSEEEFAKLTVKRKVELYTQFINEMSKKNPKFVKQAELMEASAKKSKGGGEVVNEKQASVKYLLAKLEASCGLPRQKVSVLPLQRLRTNTNAMQTPNKNAKLTAKAKEFEDILESPISRHISTLTVKLQPCKTTIYKGRSTSLPRYKTENNNDFKATIVVEPAHKRNNEQMRYSLPFETFAPPKKIRRTRAERLAPKIFFQSEKLKNLFFIWLSERGQVQNATKAEQADLISNLKEEPLPTKLENKDNSSSKDNDKETTKIKQPEPKPRQRKKRPAPPIPVPEATSKANNSALSENFSGVKAQANDESESGLSLIQKITSDESQADGPEVKNDKDLEVVKHVRPPTRKKKLRRTLTWHKGESSDTTTPTTNSTDSDTEIKVSEMKNKVRFLQPPTHPSSEELDSDLLREVNSPRKIKSVYTLTAYSPSPTQEEEEKIRRCKEATFQIWPTRAGYSSSSSQEEEDTNKHFKQESSPTLSNTTENSSAAQSEEDKVIYLKPAAANKCPTQQKASSLNKLSFLDVTDIASNIGDSFIDQGFETGSNDIDSPVRMPKCFTFKKQETEQYDSLITLTPDSKETANSSGFSTPVAEQQQSNSPTAMTLKSHRKSPNDESRRNSMAMQVIREDQPLDQHNILGRPSNTKDENFSVNAPTSDMPPADLAGLCNRKTSQFWIKCGYFSLSFDIFYNDANRVRLLFNIFSQKSYDAKDLAFGIDNLIFHVSHADEKANICRRLPPKREYSHYWFSTGDLVIPFAGKRRVSPDKIQHIFEFLKTAVEASGVIRFGVDGIEFSNVREFWNHSPKFSMDSNYSMLVGLQSGDSNGLEGRSKYAWPHTKPVRVRDFNQSHNEVDNFEETTNSDRSSLSPFSDKQFDFTTSSPTELQPKPSMTGSEFFSFANKNDSLDYMLNEEYPDLPQPTAVPAALDLNKVKTQQELLSLRQDLANVSCKGLDALKGTPQYLQQLKSIVKNIINKGRRDGFGGCTFQELLSYTFFLSRYADICLHNCSDHINKVLAALLDHRAVVV